MFLKFMIEPSMDYWRMEEVKNYVSKSITKDRQQNIQFAATYVIEKYEPGTIIEAAKISYYEVYFECPSGEHKTIITAHPVFVLNVEGRTIDRIN